MIRYTYVICLVRVKILYMYHRSDYAVINEENSSAV
jgi:hypothetical protein